MYIYVTKTIGTKKAAGLFENNRDVIADRFPGFYIRRIEELIQSEGMQEIKSENPPATCQGELTDGESIQEIKSENPSAIRQSEQILYGKNKKNSLENITGYIYICAIDKGGIWQALWKACEELDCGCRIQLRAIPVKQEIIEIAELFNENPYEMESFGKLIITDKDLLIKSEKNVILDDVKIINFDTIAAAASKEDETNKSGTGTDGNRLIGQTVALKMRGISKSGTGTDGHSLIGQTFAFKADETNKCGIGTDGYSLIGYTTASKERIVINGENIRYLTPPERQVKDISDRLAHGSTKPYKATART